MIPLLWCAYVFALHYKGYLGLLRLLFEGAVDLAERPEAVDVVLPPTYQRLALHWVLIYS